MIQGFRAAMRVRCLSTTSHPSTASQALKPLLGQPTPQTHPHLLHPGQVCPGISRLEFQTRRYRLMEALGSHSREAGLRPAAAHMAIIPSATRVYMSGKIPYPFRQQTEFLYLTGFQEPDSVLVLSSVENKDLPEHKSTLFVPKRHPQTELWEGPRSSPEDVPDLLGVDEAFPMEELESFLQTLLCGKERWMLWYDFLHPSLPSCHRTIEDLVKDAPNSVSFELESLPKLQHQLRVVKSEAEILLMRKSGAIGAKALKEAMCSGAGLEAELWAHVELHSRLQGAQRLAYPPVVAGGSRANTIHYTHNNAALEPGTLVLMDAGCEYHGYASDITRTWPVNGRFSAAQQAVYEAVLEIQQELIELCAERLSLNQLYSAMTQLLGGRLQSLGIVPARVGKMELTHLVHSFCPHHVGHYLGLDVHDCPQASRSQPLMPGMVVTIEPGLYLREDNPWVPPQFRGIGVRIEDDVLITAGKPEVLSSHCPKDVSEVCRLLANDKN